LPGESNDGKVKEARWQSLIGLSHGGEYPKHRKSLALRKRLKLALLRFLPHEWYINPWYITFTLAWLKSGLKEQMRRWLVRRMIALDKLMRFRALRCPFNLRFLYIRDVCSAARRRYKLMLFLGRIDLFRAEHQAPTDLFEEDPLLGWGGMAAGGIEVHRLPGCHDQIFEKPGVAIFAHQLKACLAQAKGDLR
jgi:hypothetical protein